MPRLAPAACFTIFYRLSARMTNLKAALRDWQCKPKPPPDSGSIIPHCLICFCPSNAPYVGGFVLIMAFAPIAGRGWFLSPRLFARFLKAPFTALAEPDHLIVPTPFHAKQYLHRRFNQSAELARLLCQQNETGIFAPEALTRPKASPTQAGLSRSQRQRNLAGAFAVPQD